MSGIERVRSECAPLVKVTTTRACSRAMAMSSASVEADGRASTSDRWIGAVAHLGIPLYSIACPLVVWAVSDGKRFGVATLGRPSRFGVDSSLCGSSSSV